MTMNTDPVEHTGHVLGAPYRICIPQQWNGELFMSAHGWASTGTSPQYKDSIDIPMGNPDILARGSAWAASGFHPRHFVPFADHNFVPVDAAEDLSALHDHFLSEFGVPDRTLATGLSMGGNVVLSSLEMEPDRYDGAIVWATAAGRPTLDYEAHVFVVAAVAAGIDPGSYQGIESIPSLSATISEILVGNADAQSEFLDLWTGVSGGARPSCPSSLAETYQAVVGATVPLAISRKVFDNTDFVYPGSGSIEAAKVNSLAIRISADPIALGDRNLARLRGHVPVPLLMMHTTGDSGAALSALQEYKRAAINKGSVNKLVQRCVQSSGHGDFTDQETIDSLDAFFSWLDDGIVPEADDLLGDLSHLGERFTDVGGRLRAC